MKDLNDLRKLINITKNHFTALTFEATVDTGFEATAYEECIEKFGKNTTVSKTRGRIFFNTKFDKYHLFNNLRSVDHVNVLAGCHTVSFLGGQHKNLDLEKVRESVQVFDWEKALSVWQDVNQFKGLLFPSKKDLKYALSFEKEKIKPTEVTRRYGFDEEYLKNRPKVKSQKDDEVVFKTENEPNAVKSELEISLDNVCDGSDDDDDDEQPSIQSCSNCGDERRIPRFRVTCNRTGSNHSFTSMDAAWVFGGELHDKFHWLIDLKKYDLEVILEIVDNDMYVGISLNKYSRHRRNIHYFSYTTLRATVCYNMLRLCQPKIGDIIIDPMCGGGSIPIEGTFAFPHCYYICGDESINAINKTVNNINHNKYLGNPTNVNVEDSQSIKTNAIIEFDESLSINKKMNIDSLYWDVTCLPLRDNSIDIFVTDLPFGKRSGSKSNNKLLYKKVLEELARVVNLTNGRCVFLTHDKKCFTKSYHMTHCFWRQVKFLNVNIGGLEAGCYVLQRSDKPYEVRLTKSERKRLARLEWIKKKKQDCS